MVSPTPTTWTIHLAARRPGRAVAAVLVIVLALFGVAALAPREWGTIGTALAVVVAAVLLLGAIAEFLLPVTYTLDGDGAHVRMLGRRHRLLPWRRVRRVYLRQNELTLSPRATRGWMDQYRGVSLRTFDRDAVLAQVRAWLQEAGVTAVESEEA